MARISKRALVACFATLLTGASAPSLEDRLERDRNLGKAFYENPTTQKEAAAEFKSALELAPDSNRERLNYALALLHAGQSEQAVALLRDVQKRDPKLPHTWFNLGLYFRKNGDADLAVAQFEGMLKLTPEEPVAHYQLGSLLKQQGKLTEAAAQFEQAAKLNPLLAGAHFQLYNLYRQAGRSGDAAAQLATFQTLKKQQAGAAVAEDVDWCNYAEIYDPPKAVSAVADEPAPTWVDAKLPGLVDAKTTGLVAIDLKGRGSTDLLVWSSGGILLYGQGRDLIADSGLGGLKDVVHVAPGDFDNDGLMDLCVVTTSGASLYRNGGGKFAKVDASLPAGRFDRAVWMDYDHDYDLDLILLGPASVLLRNQGSAGFADRTADFPFVNGRVTEASKLRMDLDGKGFDLAVAYADHAPVLYRDGMAGNYTVEAFKGAERPSRNTINADFDGDGRVERVRIADDGSVHLMRNANKSSRRWLRVQLAGVKSLKLGLDAMVEVKAGSLYRRQMYEGVPLVFDMADYPEADVVRITWMNGLIQNETHQAANTAHRYEEAQRLSGSCPMVWTWNGAGFEFITDVLGVAPLGAAAGDGSYFPVDHQEYVSIPGRALKAVDGHYEVRVTEELSEVSYIDQVRLLAVDHRAGTEIFTGEKFKAPPFPALRLYEVKSRVHPVSARDEKGGDVTAAVLKADGVYPDGFARDELGVAETHTLELDFGSRAAPGGKAALFLRGWVDWPDGSTFRAASQSKTAVRMPELQMQDSAGRWQTVNADMGMPAGKPKTIAVDLRFLSASRKLRIVTNLCVYWDEIFLGESAVPDVIRGVAALESADLHFRGFSESKTDAARKQPDTYSYANVTATSFWNPTPGFYTRYGDVADLMGEVDDRFAIMGSGDELTLRFAAASLPDLKPGWTRDFLLKVDGWAKDRDANTAFAGTVEPLPFHAMGVYPYPPSRHFPADPAHRAYQREYNTRPALRLVRPLSD